ncbi:polar amino acid transport system permease protein [Arthrobacter ginsengisoli]|uniref:Polar amino acid transport system permease protein n=1 Tax=Arthrobacter ginsengisoli TaxID=1356565 RepID=A0ABU1UDX5_9MICC|nr:amino acid ABC transporter permease [Arthrobacter ginsengisoli]MDR7083399.1 polar amino acid transport system permease protein [Arthrobacter ginsengisoli]
MANLTESVATAPPATNLATDGPKIHRRKHPWTIVGAVVALAVLGLLLYSLATNPNIGVEYIQQYLFDPMTIAGVGVTIFLTVASMIVGTAIAVVVAVMRLSSNPVLKGIATLYVWLLRGTPLLIQLIFWAYLGALYDKLSLGIPFTSVTFWTVDTSSLITPTIAALLALTINQGAYAAEIIRAGIMSVDSGQTEAAMALGMTSARTLRRIVLPQAMRTIIPPMGNETLSMLKATSLVSVIGGLDLLTNLQHAYAQNFQVIPLLIVGCMWYLFLTTVISIPQAWLEKRYGRGVQPIGGSSTGMFTRLFAIKGK